MGERQSPAVGDTVYYMLSFMGDDKLQEGKVVKVGRKYFYVGQFVDDRNPYKIDKKLFCDVTEYGYGHTCRVYLSRKAYYEEKRREALHRELSGIFNSYKLNLTLEQLEHCYKIVKEGRKNCD